MRQTASKVPFHAESTTGLPEPDYLANLFNIAFDAIIFLDRQEHITIWNPAAERMYGWTAAEAQGRKPPELYWPVETPAQKQDQRRRRASLKAGETVQGEYQTRHKDGTLLWVEYMTRTIFDEQGKISGYAAMYRNITERKQAEQAITEFARQQEALYKLTDQLHRTAALADIYDSALDGILSALQCDRASILLFDQAGVMRFVAWRGLSDGYRQATDGHSPWKPDAQNPAPIYYNDLASSDLGRELKSVIKKEGIRSLAFIPLVTNGRLIGKFMAYFNSPHVFNENELDLSLTLARQLAFGIEHKRAEEKLRSSEALYRAIARSIPGGGVYVVDKDMRYIVAEGPVTERFDLTREMLEGHTPSEVFDADMSARLEARLQRCFAGETISYETRYKGRVFWTQQAPLVDAIGQAILVTVDITERKMAEEALRASEERYRGLFDSVPVAVYTCDAEGLIQEYNQRAAELWGREPQKNDPQERYCGSFKIFHPDGRFMPAGQCPMSRILHGETLQPHEYEILVERPDGTRRNVVASPKLLRNENGEIAGAINCLFDITERREALTRARELAAIVEGSHDAIWRKTLDGIITNWNQGAEELFGYTAEEMIGRPVSVLMPPERKNEMNEILSRIKRGERVEHFETERVRKDGTRLFISKTVSPIFDERGVIVAASSIARDITYRRQEEAQLSLLAQIGELVREMSDPDEFLYAVAAAIGEHLDIRRSFFVEIDQAHDRGFIWKDFCRGVPSVAGEYRLSEYSAEAGREMDHGHTVVNHDSKTDPRTAAYYEGTYKRNGERAYISVPLMRDGKRVAALWVSTDVPRMWTDEEARLLETVAERAWLAVEKIRLDKEVRRERELLQKIFDNIPVMITRYQPDTSVMQLNPAFEQATGWTAAEAETVDFMSACYPDPAYREEVRQFMEDAAGGWKDILMTTRDGRTLQTTWANVRLQDGTQVGIGLDISQRKQMEDALRQSEERFVRFMQHLPGLAWIKDDQGRYVYANAAAEKAFRTPRLQLYGKTDYEVFPPETAAQFVQNDRMALNEGRGVQVVEALEQGDGVVHHSLVSKFPIPGPDGRTALIGGTAFDIQDRIQAEEQLKLLNENLEQKVQERTAEVRQLASALTKAEQRERHRIAHILHDDLQQRLYTIQMEIAYLRDGPEKDRQELHTELATMKNQLEEVLAITRHLSIDLSPPILHDEGLAHAIAWLASQMQEQHGLRVELQADGSFAIPDEDIQVLLFNCVRELLFNIVKHAGVNQAMVTLQRLNTDLRILIRDRGKGFDVTALTARPLDGAQRPQSFGIPTIRHQIGLFGGRMDIDSQAGTGTSITLTIPVFGNPPVQ